MFGFALQEGRHRMTMKDQSRQEPILADLASLERLLKESLPQEPHPAAHDALGNAYGNNSGFAAHELKPLDLSGFGLTPSAPRAEHEMSLAAPKSENQAQQSFNDALMQLSRIVETPAVSPTPDRYDDMQHDYGFDRPAHVQQEAQPTFSFQDDWHNAPMPPAPAPLAEPAPYPVPPYASYGVEHGVEALNRPALPDKGWELPPEPPLAPAPASFEPSPLERAEAQLAAEAARASSESVKNVARSRHVFFALAGLAVAGIATVIGMSMMMGRGKPVHANADGIPVIAAKTTPAKEKPENPGGIEIPDQNKQVLASRGTVEPKPTQILNTAEQPVDLTQLTRKDPVRVIVPNPLQSASPPEGQQEGASPAGLEPKRVSSVRLGSSGEVTSPAAPPKAAEELNRTIAASTTPLPPSRPSAPASTAAAPVAAPSLATPALPQTAAKVESRPAAPPPSTVRPAPSTPAAAPTSPAPRTNAPMPLTQQANAAPALRTNAAQSPAPRAATSSASGGAGGYAIQLASRPTEADARAASSQLRTRYSEQLGGKPVNVVSGEANGRTVFRVRAGGFTQADANAACDAIKAAGGGCFVTKQ
jgi:hypothetical protein